MAIYFIPYYYYSVIKNSEKAKAICYNGYAPFDTSIFTGDYPLRFGIYACVRSDVDKNSPAYRILRYLCSDGGQKVVRESKYVPADGAANGAVSGITDAERNTEKHSVKAYSLSGCRLASPVKGLNIVRKADGTVVKTIK